MTERSRLRLEQMLPEIDSFRQAKILTQEEATQMIERRRFLEERLDDSEGAPEKYYMEYADHFSACNKLIRKRKRKTGTKCQKGDIGLRSATLHLWARYVRAFRHRPEAWMKYCDYLSSRNMHHKLQQTLAKALALHPRVSTLWLRAASTELRLSGEVSRARGVFQSGLRVNPSDPTILLGAIKLELDFADGMRPSLEGQGVDNPSLRLIVDGGLAHMVLSHGLGAMRDQTEVRGLMGGLVSVAGEFSEVPFAQTVLSQGEGLEAWLVGMRQGRLAELEAERQRAAKEKAEENEEASSTEEEEEEEEEEEGDDGDNQMEGEASESSGSDSDTE
ncbi:hypothetical protein KIPB_000701 [Kipferlia bialata]|uniref:U3 small nucleolar RNA-associated protein 6 N-terminal domain-containing protein n=1 Tax=Kipferlia bialata TaxID=797122 RepID=A0A9K3CQY4_9EUKA|nr:hypothetical protein KIPB_000701 [Kipferlia bialata]|eukprot:g701.t1